MDKCSNSSNNNNCSFKMKTLMKNGEYKHLKEITLNETKFDEGIDIFNQKVKSIKNNANIKNNNFNNKSICTTNPYKYKKSITLWKGFSNKKAFPKELIYKPKYTLIDKHIPSIYLGKPFNKKNHSVHINKSV